MAVYNVDNKKSNLEAEPFFDESGTVTIARYDQVRHPRIETLTRKQISFFWVPEEIDISQDKKDFADLPPEAQHIFTSNLKRQILLDSVQGRSPNLAFLPIVSLPELETFIETWSFFETIHSRSYTHIIRNIYPNPSDVFDEINNIPEIIDCAESVSKYYDDLIEYANLYQQHGEGKYDINVTRPDGTTHTYTREFSLYELKKKLWMCLMSVNVLEGVRFYVSFACSWAFAENKKMEGNAKIIKLICRDENLHLQATQYMLNTMLKDDPDFVKIREETQDECIELYLQAGRQEKQWTKYLFKDGSIVGLNAPILDGYVDWIVAKRMQAVGLKCPYPIQAANPLPWTMGWIGGDKRQVAAQEAELSSYVIGAISKHEDDYDFGTINSDDL